MLSNTPWYDDIEEATPEMREIQLGSNPSKNNFDFMSKGSNKSIEMKSNSKNSSIMENVMEEDATKIVIANNHVMEQQMNAAVQKTVVMKEHQNNGNEKKQIQALLERDSANHSPISGVLEGSVNDEARSEGSTDSGKGLFTCFKNDNILNYNKIGIYS